MGFLSPLSRLFWGEPRLVHHSMYLATDRVPSHPEPGVCVRIQQEGRHAHCHLSHVGISKQGPSLVVLC